MKESGITSKPEFKNSVITFFKELYLNSYEYARAPVRQTRNVKSVRILQLRYIVVNNKNELDQLIEGHPVALQTYARAVWDDLGSTAFVRLIASDFGDGMLDFFLRSEPGQQHHDDDRTELLQRLIHTTLSSKKHTGAGLGLADVIDAAANLRAFVSLRTDKHWLSSSFLTSNEKSCQSFVNVAGIPPHMPQISPLTHHRMDLLKVLEPGL